MLVMKLLTSNLHAKLNKEIQIRTDYIIKSRLISEINSIFVKP